MPKGNRLGSGVIIAMDAEFASEPLGSGQWWGRVGVQGAKEGEDDHPLKEAMIQVSYSGTLAKKGSRDIYMHYGYGPEWSGLATLPMVRIRPGHWIISVYAVKEEVMNFCFVDSEGNWDNNDGSDWSFRVRHTKRKGREHMI